MSDDPEAPTPDAAEQATPADPTVVAPDTPSRDPEAPEADAIEQALPGPLDDEEERR